MTTTQDAPAAGRRAGGRLGKIYADPHIGFAWLRLLGAMVVIFDHSAALTHPEDPSFLPASWPLGDFAILAFFAMSGYQIHDSWERDPSWWRFSARRVLRIVPPLAVVLAFTAFVIGPLFTTLSTGDYFGNGQTWAYLYGVIPFLQEAKLPGVFDSNPHNYSVNPSLWTLPMEVIGYGIVLVLGVAIAVGLSRWVLPLLLAGLLFQQGYFFATVGEYGAGGYLGNMPLAFIVKFMIAFVAGVVIHTFRHKIPLRPRYALALFGAWLVVHIVFLPDASASTPGWTDQGGGPPFWQLTLDKWLLALAAAYGAIVLAHHWPKRLENGARWVYGSYGLYIWGAPWQQAFVAMGITTDWVILAMTLPLAYTLGLLSWHFVEMPTQKWRRYLRAKQLPMTEGDKTDGEQPEGQQKEPAPAKS